MTSQTSNGGASAAGPSQAAPHSPERGDSTYYPAFDWLRGCLAVVVMLYHDKLLAWTHAGNFAVVVFFALSGWLIGGILLQLTRADLPRFFFNRSIRIWIPYYIALALLVSASLLRDHVTMKWLEFVAYKVGFVYNLFGTQQLATNVLGMPLQGTGNHFWSVNAEEQFYLLSPLLLVLAPARWGRHPFTWVVIAALAVWAEYYGGIVLGVLAAVLVGRYGSFHQTPVGRAVALTVALGAGICLALDFHYEVVAPFCAIAIVLLLAFKGKRRPLGAIVGGMSYPLYLNHWIGVFTVNAAMKSVGLNVTSLRHIVAAVLNLGIATAMYWWIDRRLLARRGRWFSRKRGRLVICVGYGVTAFGVAFGLAMLAR